MVVETTRDGKTWYQCEKCGLLAETVDEATQHEVTCDGEDPTYVQ